MTWINWIYDVSKSVAALFFKKEIERHMDRKPELPPRKTSQTKTLRQYRREAEEADGDQ